MYKVYVGYWKSYTLTNEDNIKPGLDIDLYNYLVNEVGFEGAINNPALKLSSIDKQNIREYVKLRNV